MDGTRKDPARNAPVSALEVSDMKSAVKMDSSGTLTLICATMITITRGAVFETKFSYIFR